MIPLGPIIALVAALVPVAILIAGADRVRRTRKWRPRQLPELNADCSPMSISQAAATIEHRLKEHWRDQPQELHRLERLLLFFDSRATYSEVEQALCEVQTWPEDLDEPTELADRIFWDFQTFIDANHCAAFCAATTKRYFLVLVETLAEAGIHFPDAASVSFDRI